jgi:hypothetical protein
MPDRGNGGGAAMSYGRSSRGGCMRGRGGK